MKKNKFNTNDNMENKYLGKFINPITFTTRISQPEFESILYQYTQKYKNNFKTNFYTLYHNKGIYLNVFYEGSSFCFKKSNIKLSFNGNIVTESYTKVILKNDEFPNLYKYEDKFMIEEISTDEIIFRKVLYNDYLTFYQILVYQDDFFPKFLKQDNKQDIIPVICSGSIET